MNYTKAIDYAVNHTWLSISYADALPYFNKRRNEIVNIIKDRVNKDFFFDIFTTDLVSWQREYPLPIASDSTVWITNIERLEMYDKSTDTYRSLKENKILTNKSFDELANIHPSKWSYIVRDSSLFIFPTPTENITDWIVMYATNTLRDVTESSTADDIFQWHSELREYMQLIADGVVIDLYAKARQYDDKNIAQQDYNDNIQKMIKALGNRTLVVAYEEMPDLSYLE